LGKGKRIETYNTENISNEIWGFIGWRTKSREKRKFESENWGDIGIQ
jgi:hypothetical protein